jgi:aminomethyltransferase
MDLSALRKFDVTGPDAEALLQKVQTRDLRKLAVGQVVYTAVCHAHGGMMDDGTVFRLGRDVFRFVCGEDTTGLWLREQAAAGSFDVHIRDATDALHNLAVQGPKSRELLARSVDRPGPAGHRRARLVPLHRRPPGRPHRHPAGGVAHRLHRRAGLRAVRPQGRPAVWTAVMEAGAPLGIVPLGFDALDMLRIEAGLAFAGHEFCDQTDPFEAGIGFTVALSKPEDFIGKAALEERKAHPRRKLVGLAIASNEPPATATASTWAAPRWARSPAPCARRCSTPRSPWRGWTWPTRPWRPRCRWASWTGTASGWMRRWWPSAL